MRDYQVDFRRFQDKDGLAAALAGFIAATLQAAVAEKGGASLVVSGGSTPVPLFQALSRADIAWAKVLISLADERWVDPAEPDSNENLVRLHLLRNHAAAAGFVGLKTADATARQGEETCRQRLLAIPRPFDLLVLGMGSDGHTASLFPGAAELARATDPDSGRLCQAVRPPAASHERMTMTLPALLAARRIILLITGSEKMQVLEKALATAPRSAEVLNEMPIRHVLAGAGSPVTVYWAP